MEATDTLAISEHTEIPRELLERAGLKAGDTALVSARPGEIVVRSAAVEQWVAAGENREFSGQEFLEYLAAHPMLGDGS